MVLGADVRMTQYTCLFRAKVGVGGTMSAGLFLSLWGLTRYSGQSRAKYSCLHWSRPRTHAHKDEHSLSDIQMMLFMTLSTVLTIPTV